MSRFNTLSFNRKAAVVAGNVLFFGAFAAQVFFNAPIKPMAGIEILGITIELMGYFFARHTVA